MWLIYIVKCSDGTLYTGMTNDLSKRMGTHNRGKGGAYTRSRKPVKLVYTEKCRTRGKALKREAAIKKLNRKGKEKLIGRINVALY